MLYFSQPPETTNGGSQRNRWIFLYNIINLLQLRKSAYGYLHYCHRCVNVANSVIRNTNRFERLEALEAGIIIILPELLPPPFATFSGVSSIKPSPILHKSAKLQDWNHTTVSSLGCWPFSSRPSFSSHPRRKLYMTPISWYMFLKWVVGNFCFYNLPGSDAYSKRRMVQYLSSLHFAMELGTFWGSVIHSSPLPPWLMQE